MRIHYTYQTICIPKFNDRKCQYGLLMLVAAVVGPKHTHKHYTAYAIGHINVNRHRTSLESCAMQCTMHIQYHTCACLSHSHVYMHRVEPHIYVRRVRESRSYHSCVLSVRHYKFVIPIFLHLLSIFVVLPAFT